jgi:hypothetical protein
VFSKIFGLNVAGFIYFRNRRKKNRAPQSLSGAQAVGRVSHVSLMGRIIPPHPKTSITFSDIFQRFLQIKDKPFVIKDLQAPKFIWKALFL